MRHSTWLIPAAAAASLGALTWLFPAHDIYAQLFKPRVTRQQAIAAARALTHQYGVDTSAWSWAVTTETHNDQAAALSLYPQSAVLASMNPLSLRVLATAPSGDSILTTLEPSGRPTSYLRRDVKPATGAPPSPQTPPELLARELARYAGKNSGSFDLTSSGVASQEGVRTVWEWTDPARPGIVARLELVVNNGAVMRATYSTETAFRLVARARRGQQSSTGILIGAVLTIGSLLAFLALWSFFSSMTARMDHIRFGLSVSLLAAAPILANWLGGTIANQAAFASLDAGSTSVTIIAGGITGSLLIFLGIALLCAAGYALLPEQTKPHWVALRLVSQGRILTAPVGREITLGLLGGVAISSLFYLPAAIPSLTHGYVFLSSASSLISPTPALAPLSGLTLGFDLLALFALLLPWLERRHWRTWLRHTVFAAAGVIILAAFRQPFPRDLTAGLIAGALVLPALVAIYKGTGVLAIWWSSVGLVATLQAATQFACGTPSYHAQGLVTASLWSAALVAAAVVWRFGAVPDARTVLDSMQPRGSAISHSDRDRLLAEFSVARRAQEGMLPLAPPVIPGYSLAAACQPAREVGGDLYDFLAFPGGDWGLCVADVSGKGVPSALYMTLTKGMLVSAASRPPDLALIASRINRYLYEAGRRRTFVTMSLGVLDSATGLFRHIRAGHNPPLLYSAAGRSCRYLMPNGIGLGITASRAFENNLEVGHEHLSPGDVLVLYSDGLTECMDSNRRLYGEDRLSEILRRNAHLNAIGIQDAILSDSRAFRGAAEPHDDLTIVVLRAEARDSLR